MCREARTACAEKDGVSRLTCAGHGLGGGGRGSRAERPLVGVGQGLAGHELGGSRAGGHELGVSKGWVVTIWVSLVGEVTVWWGHGLGGTMGGHGLVGSRAWGRWGGGGSRAGRVTGWELTVWGWGRGGGGGGMVTARCFVSCD